MKNKTKEELEKLTTERLLAYYKAERGRYYRHIANYRCGCGCGEMKWDIYADGERDHNDYKEAKKEEEKWDSYLHRIRDVLRTRGHVIK